MLMLSILFLAVLGNGTCYGKFKPRAKSSAIEIMNGAKMVVKNSVTNYTGKIVKDAQSGISGEGIVFDKGIYEDSGNELEVSGRVNFDAGSQVMLDGDKSFNLSKGKMPNGLRVSGKGNRLEGVPLFDESIQLQDANATLTIAIHGALSTDLQLNGGQLVLEQNLLFADDKRVTGSGKIKFNGRKLQIGAQELTWSDPIYLDSANDISLNGALHLAETWTFSGSSILNGNGNILYLENLGNIVIESGSKLLIKNIVIQKLGASKIRCRNNAGTVTFQNTHLMLSSDFTFSNGSLQFLDEVAVHGNGKKFIYQSSQTSTIRTSSELFFEKGVTFSYDPIVIASKKLIVFEDSTAELHLNAATLYVTVKGMHLEKGAIVVRGNSSISYEKHDARYATYGLVKPAVDERIRIGSNVSAYDCAITIKSGSKLILTQGSLQYSNVDATSFSAEDESSVLRINSNAHLLLENSLNIGPGVLEFQEDAFLGKALGKQIIGSQKVGRVHKGRFHP